MLRTCEVTYIFTLNTGRCFTASCKQLTAGVEEFECYQVSSQAERFFDCQQNQQVYTLQIKLTQIRVDGGNALCCCQVNNEAQHQFLFSFIPENLNSYHEVSLCAGQLIYKAHIALTLAVVLDLRVKHALTGVISCVEMPHKIHIATSVHV